MWQAESCGVTAAARARGSVRSSPAGAPHGLRAVHGGGIGTMGAVPRGGSGGRDRSPTRVPHSPAGCSDQLEVSVVQNAPRTRRGARFQKLRRARSGRCCVV